jgi:hypothetical protein
LRIVMERASSVGSHEAMPTPTRTSARTIQHFFTERTVFGTLAVSVQIECGFSGDHAEPPLGVLRIGHYGEICGPC